MNNRNTRNNYSLFSFLFIIYTILGNNPINAEQLHRLVFQDWSNWPIVDEDPMFDLFGTSDVKVAQIDINGDDSRDFVARLMCNNHWCDYYIINYSDIVSKWLVLSRIESWSTPYFSFDTNSLGGRYNDIIVFDKSSEDCMACSLPTAVRMAWQPNLASYTKITHSKTEYLDTKLDWNLIQNELPFLVKYEISQSINYCIESGGTPKASQEFVRFVDFTGDGLLDYILDGNELICPAGTRYLDYGMQGSFYILFEGIGNNGVRLLASFPSNGLDIIGSKDKNPSVLFVVPGISNSGVCIPDHQPEVETQSQRQYCWTSWQVASDFLK